MFEFLFCSITIKVLTRYIFVLIGLYRATNVLKHYRGFTMPSGKKFDSWVERLFDHPSFKCTCSTEELYIDSYERWVIYIFLLFSDHVYDEYSAMLSIDPTLAKLRTLSILGEGFPEMFIIVCFQSTQGANAINSGRGLPCSIKVVRICNTTVIVSSL